MFKRFIEDMFREWPVLSVCSPVVVVVELSDCLVGLYHLHLVITGSAFSKY